VRANLVKVLRRQAKDVKEDTRKADFERKVVGHLEEMTKLKPKHPGIFYRLGMSLKSLERTDEAIQALERHLDAAAETEASKQPGMPTAAFAAWKTAQTKHWLAVMKGENTATAPPEYVASLFDDYAERFEEHLVQQLHYNTPALVAEEIKQVVQSEKLEISEWRRCADLGAGTGLMGPPLRTLGFRGRLEGVDLSERMLIQAIKKGGRGVGYDRLLCGDLLEIFTPISESDTTAAADSPLVSVERSIAPQRIEVPSCVDSYFQLVVAADVFVYIGDLEPTFQRVARWLSPGGVFAFSTESLDDGQAVEAAQGFRLTESGRYVHAPKHIRKLGEAEGLISRSCQSVVLRMNGGKPVRGHVHVMVRPQ
jgi:predicted TPR repeat methyltransferase